MEAESGVCHRDLTPENFLFLFQTKEPVGKNTLKVIDMGLPCTSTPGKVLGTPYYVAPQVLVGKYDQSSDLWSCGVTMYVLLCGYPPLFGDVLAKVRFGNFSFNDSDRKNISDDAKDLIRMLLKMNPKDRYTAVQTLNHEWISFMALDGNGDGLLTAHEMKEGLQKAGLKDIPPDLHQIMEDIDSDGNGVVDYAKFLAATLGWRVYVQEDVCWAAFRTFDLDGDGKISQVQTKAVPNDDSVSNVMGMQDIAELRKT